MINFRKEYLSEYLRESLNCSFSIFCIFVTFSILIAFFEEMRWILYITIPGTLFAFYVLVTVFIDYNLEKLKRKKRKK
jgi:hypothetical protein